MLFVEAPGSFGLQGRLEEFGGGEVPLEVAESLGGGDGGRLVDGWLAGNERVGC